MQISNWRAITVLNIMPATLSAPQKSRKWTPIGCRKL